MPMRRSIRAAPRRISIRRVVRRPAVRRARATIRRSGPRTFAVRGYRRRYA